MAGKEVQAAASARLYDFGAITIALQAPIVDEPWGTFVRNVNAVDRGFQAEDTWDRLVRQLRDLLEPAFIRPGCRRINHGRRLTTREIPFGYHGATGDGTPSRTGGRGLRLPAQGGAWQLRAAVGSVLTELPAGRINRHWTKNLYSLPPSPWRSENDRRAGR